MRLLYKKIEKPPWLHLTLIIVISNSKKKPKILSELVVEEQLEQVPKQESVDVEELQLPMTNDFGEAFLQELFQEK